MKQQLEGHDRSFWRFSEQLFLQPVWCFSDLHWWSKGSGKRKDDFCKAKTLSVCVKTKSSKRQKKRFKKVKATQTQQNRCWCSSCGIQSHQFLWFQRSNTVDILWTDHDQPTIFRGAREGEHAIERGKANNAAAAVDASIVTIMAQQRDTSTSLYWYGATSTSNVKVERKIID